MVLSDHYKTRLVGIVVSVREAITTSLAIRCDRRWVAPIGGELHNPLGAKFRVEDFTICAESNCTTPILVDPGAHVAVLWRHIDGISLGLIRRVGIVSAKGISTALLRSAFQPQQISCRIDVEPADANTTRCDRFACDGRFPCAVRHVKRRCCGGSG